MLSEIYTIRMTQRTDGTDVAVCEVDGRKFQVATRNGAEMAICRVLKNAGVPDGPWQVVGGRPEKQRLYGRSTHASAGVTVLEGNGRPRFAKWQPHPMARTGETA